jgi:L-threonylcarbamoyladenylate synthase
MSASGVIPIDRHHPAPSDLLVLARHLRRGRPVVLPTETQYALAADATSQDATARVRQIKGRGAKSPFSIFLAGVESCAQWRIKVPECAALLAHHFWPGPVTLILPTANPLFKLLGGKGDSVGVRVTPEPVIAELLARLRGPLLATSANPSGVLLAPEAENRWLAAQARSGDLLWAKPTRYHRRRASTIIDCTGRVPIQLRPGPISEAEWRSVLYNHTGNARDRSDGQ